MGHVAAYGLWVTWAVFSIITSWRLLLRLQRLSFWQFLILLLLSSAVVALIYQTVPPEDPISSRPTQEVIVSLIVWYPVIGGTILLWLTPEPRSNPRTKK